MKALIAFIVMALVILTLIEINERLKKKRLRDHEITESREPEDCSEAACTDCSLLDICDKDKKTNI
jgi:large-conductance mechanosensitive channel